MYKRQEYTSLVNTDGASDGYVMIGDHLYLAGTSGVGDYLAYYVEFYYLDDKGEYTVVYADPAKKSSDLRIYADEIDRFEDNKYYYYDNENASRTTSASLIPTADVIYNGKAMPCLLYTSRCV